MAKPPRARSSAAARRQSAASRSGRTAPPPFLVTSTTSIDYLPNPIIGQSIAPPPGAAGERPMMREDGDSTLAPILSYALPEPTSYSGTNVMVLEGAGLRPRTRDTLLKFDGKSVFVDCGNPPQLQASDGSSLTIEAWIKTKRVDGWRSIVIHGQTSEPRSAEVYLRIHDGYFEFGTWSGKEDVGCAWNQATRDQADRQKLKIRNEHLGAWVHLAGVYHAQARAWMLYVNGNLIDAVGPVQGTNTKPDATDVSIWKAGTMGWMQPGFFVLEQQQQRVLEMQKAAVAAAEKQKGDAKAVQWNIGPVGVDAPWSIGATRMDPRKNYERFFDGYIADVRVWNVARSEAEIRAGMNEAVPVFAPGTLGACWRLNEGKGAEIADHSGQESKGAVKGDKPEWVETEGPTDPLARLSRRQPDARVDTAFTLARTQGFFDALVFPRVQGVRGPAERRAAVAALKDLDAQTFRAFYDSGQHLSLYRNMAGVMTYRFVQTPRTASPRLALVEEYTLSSFLGAYGVGRTLKTFSLLPGETAKVTVRTTSRSEEVRKQASSILDSYSQETSSDFESSLQQEQSRKSASSEEYEAHIEASASGSWGFGSASVSAGASASANSSREEFGKSVAASTSKHAARASANRNVQIDTSSQSTTSTERVDEVVRDIRNINVGRTLNFVFRQMNQEYISLLHLTDVRLGYTDGIEPLREYPLYELDGLLERVMQPGAADAAREDILEIVRKIKDFRGEEHTDFVTAVAGATPERVRVNKDKVTEYHIVTTDTKRKVAGVIISASSIVMRTDDVVVEAVIGRSSALDQYAEGLQAQEVRARLLENEKVDLQNRLTMLEASKTELLLQLVRSKDGKQLALYHDALAAVPGVHPPTRVVSVWEGNGDGARTPATPER